jgi:TrmH family RNA methyltransferase
MRRIESTANISIKAWRTLHRRRDRERHGVCLVEGPREISRARHAGVAFTTVLVGDDASPSEQSLAAELAAGGAEGFQLGPAALQRVSVRSNPAQVIGIARTPRFALEELTLPATPLVLIADHIEKPGNLGAMIRSADGAGADAVVAADPISDLANPNVIRSSQGAVFLAPVAAAAATEVHEWLDRHRIRPVAATAEGSTALWDHDLAGPTAIVIGSEHAGLSSAWDEVPRVSIPMHGISDSLNASVAAAVLLYEARRQRSNVPS